MKKFVTSDGYTFWFMDGRWVDDPNGVNVDMAYDNDTATGRPIDADGSPLDGSSTRTSSRSSATAASAAVISDAGGSVRVDADFGGGWVLEGEADDRIGYLALADRAYKGGAKNVRIYRCESVCGT